MTFNDFYFLVILHQTAQFEVDWITDTNLYQLITINYDQFSSGPCLLPHPSAPALAPPDAYSIGRSVFIAIWRRCHYNPGALLLIGSL